MGAHNSVHPSWYDFHGEKPMASSFGDKLVIAISSRVLFDLSESDRIYREEGLAAYAQHQIDHENEVLQPGDAFPLVQKLLRINEKLGGEPRVEVILLSRNSADTGLRVSNSIEHHRLNISRAALCGGSSPYRAEERRGGNGCGPGRSMRDGVTR